MVQNKVNVQSGAKWLKKTVGGGVGKQNVRKISQKCALVSNKNIKDTPRLGQTHLNATWTVRVESVAKIPVFWLKNIEKDTQIPYKLRIHPANFRNLNNQGGGGGEM